MGIFYFYLYFVIITKLFSQVQVYYRLFSQTIWEFDWQFNFFTLASWKTKFDMTEFESFLRLHVAMHV